MGQITVCHHLASQLSCIPFRFHYFIYYFILKRCAVVLENSETQSFFVENTLFAYLFCYDRDFKRMLLKQFNSSSKYLDDLINIENLILNKW